MFSNYFFMLLVLKVFASGYLQGCSPFSVNTDYLNKRLTGFTFLTITSVDLNDCVRSCICLPACKSVNFDFTTLACEHNSIGISSADISHIETQQKVILSDITSWPSEVGGSCGARLCSLKQICIPTLKQHQCMDVVCDSVPVIANGEVQHIDAGQSFLLDEAAVVCFGGRVPSQNFIKCLPPDDLMSANCYFNEDSPTCTIEGKWETTPYCKIPPCSMSASQYIGTLSTTHTGRTCMRWSSNNPHQHDYWQPSRHPDGQTDHNYCRGLGETYLWCYTTDPASRWEECNKPFEVC